MLDSSKQSVLVESRSASETPAPAAAAASVNEASYKGQKVRELTRDLVFLTYEKK